ncbi:MAG: phosphate starvation-inducible protein PsiF [Hydrogenophilaceae bacterium]|nr:phosphate starvation-inducible protein PsiF [Hydrogenophilaceae bacterium]
MKHAALIFSALFAFVTAPVMADTAQQARMKECNVQAKGKTGDERKKFMSACLKGDSPAATTSGKAPTPQQQRMKVCNTEAKGKTGDERKTFMSACLKGKS